MKIFCVALLVIYNLCGIGFAQSMTNASVKTTKLDDAKPTVYLSIERKDREKAWLRMYNNTKWSLAVRTFTFYFNRRQSIILSNGRSVFALPGDEEIDSLHYYVEREPMVSNELKVPRHLHSDSYSISWIPSKGSILFSVPTDQLVPGLMIYVPFQYEWELNPQLIFNNEPQHRVYLHASDLPENTESRKQ
jgi:hypothetical protein